MGIFDPINGNRGDQPINLVGRYQTAMQRAAYSPTVAQAASRSGINPTLATRVAAREVAGEMNQALPGLLSQEAQMMEARRIEELNRERQMLATGLNIGGQVLGTALSASGGGAAAGAVAPATGAASQFVQSGNVRPSATPLPVAQYAQPVSQVSPQPMVAPTGPVTMSQPQVMADQPIYAPSAAGGIESRAQSLPMQTAPQNMPMQWQAAQAVDASAANQPIPRNLTALPMPRGQAGARRVRRPR